MYKVTSAEEWVQIRPTCYPRSLNNGKYEKIEEVVNIQRCSAPVFQSRGSLYDQGLIKY